MDNISLKFKNNFPPYDETICIGGSRRKGKILAWIKTDDATTTADIISKVAGILYEESSKFFPRPEQTEARAYFCGQLLETALKKIPFGMNSDTCHKAFSNTTPKFQLEVCIGSIEQIEAFDKKNFRHREKRGKRWFGHCYTKSCSTKDLTNLYVVVRNESKKEKFTAARIIAVAAHELIHAVDQIARAHSNFDFYTRRILFRNLFVQILNELGVQEKVE